MFDDSPYDMREPDEPGNPILSGMKHGWEWTRDIPHSCLCVWEWNVKTRAYDRTSERLECPWHEGK